jgi:hypothetical protein
MQTLDHRDSRTAAYFINGWREQRKKIVHVNHVGTEVLNRLAYSSCSHGIFYSSQCSLYFVQDGFDLIIGNHQLLNFMACRSEQPCFVLEGDVLSTRLLVAIMSDENLHKVSVSSAGSAPDHEGPLPLNEPNEALIRGVASLPVFRFHRVRGYTMTLFGASQAIIKLQRRRSCLPGG